LILPETLGKNPGLSAKFPASGKYSWPLGKIPRGWEKIPEARNFSKPLWQKQNL
jgi:hypothetical protein